MLGSMLLVVPFMLFREALVDLYAGPQYMPASRRHGPPSWTKSILLGEHTIQPHCIRVWPDPRYLSCCIGDECCKHRFDIVFRGTSSDGRDRICFGHVYRKYGSASRVDLHGAPAPERTTAAMVARDMLPWLAAELIGLYLYGYSFRK